MTTTGSPTAERSTANPYPGPRAFRRDEKLYGRDHEITQLFYRLSSERIVVLHSPSGAGKSSLVNAGLVGKLEEGERFDVWPSIRLSAATRAVEPAAGAGNRYVTRAVLSLEQGLPERRQRAVGEIAGQTLVEYIENRPHRPGAASSIVLVFDQFEEILTLDLLDVDAKQEFFRQLGEALKGPDVWALFVLREEYLALLDPYRDYVPTRLSNTFRINLLTVEAAVEAITGPAPAAGRTFTDDAALKLAQDLAKVSVQRPDGNSEKVIGRYVEPLPLQVVCHGLWERLPADTGTIGLDEVQELGNVDEALGAYYDSCIDELAGADFPTTRRLREWFSERLITRGGIRDQVLRDKDESGGLDNGLIRRLRDVHLVRSEQRAGATWYELAHDRLVDPVRNSNTAWLAKNLQLLQRQAKLWVQEDKPERLLLHRDDLKDAEVWARNHSTFVLPAERDLLDRSAKQRQAERIRVALVLGSGAFLLLVAVVIGILGKQAHDAKNRAQSARKSVASVALASAADQQLPYHRDVALLLSLEAYHMSPTTQAESSMLSALTAVRDSGARILRGNQGSVTAVTFGNDGKMLAAGGSDGRVLLWNAQQRTLGRPLDPTAGRGRKHGEVTAVALSSKGALATAYVDGTVGLWDVQKHIAQFWPASKGTVTSLAFSTDNGQRLATASSDGKVRIWDTRTPTKVGQDLEGDAMVLSSGGGHVATIKSYSDVIEVRFWVWNARTKRWGEDTDYRLLESAQGKSLRNITAVALSVKGVLATGYDNGKVQLWKLARGDNNRRKNPGHAVVVDKNSVNGVAFSQDGEMLATAGNDGTVHILDVDALGLSPHGAPLNGHQGAVSSVGFNLHGKIAAGYNDGKVLLWDVPRKTVGGALSQAIANLSTGDMSAGGKILALADSKGIVQLWDVRTNEPFGTPMNGHQGTVWTVAFSPDAHTLATAGSDGKVLLWRVPKPETATPNTPRPFGTIEVNKAGVFTVAFSPGGRELVTGDYSGRMQRWSWEGKGGTVVPRKLGNVMDGHQGLLWGVAFRKDGKTLATAGGDGTVLVWHVATSTHQEPLYVSRNGVNEIAFSRDGKTLAAAGTDGTVLLFNLADHTRQILSGNQRSVTHVAFGPGGKILASAGNDGTVVLFNLDRGIRQVLNGNQGEVLGLAFNKDGSAITAVTEKGTITWKTHDIVAPFIDFRRLQQRVCKLVAGNLTQIEWKTLFPLHSRAGLPDRPTAFCASGSSTG